MNHSRWITVENQSNTELCTKRKMISHIKPDMSQLLSQQIVRWLSQQRRQQLSQQISQVHTIKRHYSDDMPDFTS